MYICIIISIIVYILDSESDVCRYKYINLSDNYKRLNPDSQVKSAKPLVDTRQPQKQPHVTAKWKKQQVYTVYLHIGYHIRIKIHIIYHVFIPVNFIYKLFGKSVHRT